MFTRLVNPCRAQWRNPRSIAGRSAIISACVGAGTGSRPVAMPDMIRCSPASRRTGAFASNSRNSPVAMPFCITISLPGPTGPP